MVQNIKDIIKWDYNKNIMIPQPSQGMVKISYGQWTEEVSLQMKDITQWKVEKLYLWYNQRATVAKEIAHIHFPTLTLLRLDGNKIESIEGLSRVQMPHIKVLHLQDNKITSVGVIRKAAWPNLRQLFIEYNYFRDAKSLTEGCFLQLHQFSVYLTRREDRNKLTEQCFPAKMQAVSLQELYIQKNKFCFSRSTKRVLQKRWSHIDIS